MGQEAEETSARAHPPCAFPGDMHKGLPDGMQLRGWDLEGQGLPCLVHLPSATTPSPWNDVGISGTQPIHLGTRLLVFSGTKEVCAASCKDQHPREPPTNEGSGSSKKGLPLSLLPLHRPAVGSSACFSKGPRGGEPHGPSQRLPFEASLVLAFILSLSHSCCLWSWNQHKMVKQFSTN